MAAETTTPDGASPRRAELLEAAYRYALAHGVVDLSLRPLAAAIGSSPRVLILLFGSKEGLVHAVLGRAREDELSSLRAIERTTGDATGLHEAVRLLWAWLAAEEHRPLVSLWAETYVRSLAQRDGPWAGFAASSVTSWLALLERYQAEPGSATATASRTLALATLRGALLDLLATADRPRLDAAVERHVELLRAGAAR